MENRYRITYDLKNRTVSNIKFKQGDTDSSVLDVTLFDNGLAVDITGETIEFRFLKSDKTIVFQDSTTGVSIVNALQGNFECLLKNNTLASTGLVKCEIVFKKDEKTLTTTTFNFVVESSIGEDGILSTNYISLIENKIIEWQTEFEASEVARSNTFEINEGIRESEFEGIKTDYNTYKNVMIAESNVAELQNNINTNASQLADIVQEIDEPSYSEELTQDTSIFTLGTGKNASDVDVDVSNSVVNGNLDFSIEGNTLKNEVVNGNFSDGTDGWTDNGLGILSVNSGYLQSDYGTQVWIGQNNLQFNADDKYYYRFNGLASIEAEYDVGLFPNDFGGFPQELGRIQLSTYDTTYSDTFIPTISYEAIRIRKSNGVVGEYLRIKDVIILNLTQLGLEDKTIEELDSMTPTYFDGIKSVGEDAGGEGVNKIEVLTRGKNLFDLGIGSITVNGITLVSDGKTITVSGTATAITRINILNEIKFVGSSDTCFNLGHMIKIKNNDYTFGGYDFSGSKIGSIPITLIKEDRSTYQQVDTDDKIIVAMDDIYGAYIVFGEGDGGSYSFKVQLEEGTTATPYEPYTEDKINILMENSLRRVNPTVVDVYKEGSVTRSINKVTFNGGEVGWSLQSQNTTQASFKIGIADIKQGFDTGVLSNIFEFAYRAWDVLEPSNLGEEGIASSNVTSEFFIRINKSRLATEDLAGFIIWLSENPTTVYYEMETPTTETINIETSEPNEPTGLLPLNCFENGSVVIDSGVIIPKFNYTVPLNFNSTVMDNNASIKSMKDYIYNLDSFTTAYLLSLETRITTLENA